MRLTPCLFQRLFDLGTAHVFGIPGDHVLTLYETLADSPNRSILTTHEPSAGFAPDAYARLKGIGVAMGTYEAGVLNMVNPMVVQGGRPHLATAKTMAGFFKSRSFGRRLFRPRFMCFL